MPTHQVKGQRTRSKASGINGGAKEGKVAKAIESETAKLPSDIFLWSSMGAMATSLTLRLLGKGNMALFVGQWTVPFLLFGIYNKLVKLNGSESASKTSVTSR